MEVAGESRGVARGPFEHPGSPKESPKKPSGALGGVYFYNVADIMKLHLGLLGYALWEKERLNAFTRS